MEDLKGMLKKATRIALNLDPKPDGVDADKVREGWSSVDVPGWDSNQDITFLTIDISDEPISQSRDTQAKGSIGNQVKLKTEYTVVILARWVVYGPSSMNNALLIRDGLFRPDIKQIMNEQGAYLVIDPSMPRHAPELFNAKWWDRWDFSAKFNYKMVREQDWPYIVSGPVIIKTG